MYYQHMPKDISHLPRKSLDLAAFGISRRFYPGEAECAELIEWLNKKRKGESRLRVIQILSDIREFHALNEPNEAALMSVDVRGEMKMARMLLIKDKKNFERNLKRSLKLCRSINRLLSVYKVFPVLVKPTEFGWNLCWEPVYEPRKRATAPTYEEVAAVLDLVHLAKDGLLTRVNNCPCCSKWFFARFRHQKFCSTRCQQKHYWQSPEWKHHRRTYLRSYKLIKSLPNVK